MRRDVLCDAIGAIEYEFIEEYTDLKRKLKRRKNRMKGWLKYSAAAACLALAVCIGAAVVPMFNHGDDGGNDEAYAVYFGNFLYEPIAVGDHSGYPAIKALMVGATSDNKYDIREEHLGEYIGVFPGAESIGLEEGAAYHFAAYPDYDSVIIVERGGEYSFYVSEGNALSDAVAKDSSSAFLTHGLPESAEALYTEHFETLLDIEIAADLFSCLDGKDATDASMIERSKYDAWCALYGESGVFFDGKTFSYESEEKYQDFYAFVNENIHSLWIKTDKGFQNLLILIDLKFNYFTFCGNSYLLSEEECEALSKLICAE